MTDSEQTAQMQAIAETLNAAHHDWSDAISEFAAYLGGLAKLEDWPTIQKNSSDVYLAWCCQRNSTAALAYFWSHYLPVMRRVVQRITRDADQTDDVIQEGLQHLFVAREERSPALSTYQGRSSLSGWLRTVMTRMALARVKLEPAKIGDDQDVLRRAVSAEADPRWVALRQQTATAVSAALHQSLLELQPEERLLLQQHWIDNLTIDDLATIYSVHRATVARRIAKSKDELLASIRRMLSTQWQVCGSDLDSLLGIAQSRIEITLRALVTPGDFDSAEADQDEK